MTALAASFKNFSNKSKVFGSLGLPTKAGKVFYSGASVAFDVTGYLVPAAATAGLRTAGIADLANRPSLDTTGLNDGDKLIDVKWGIFPRVNGTSTDACTQADVGNDVYLLDDQTISRLPGAGRAIAGQLVKFEGSVPYVLMFMPHKAGTSSGSLYQGAGSFEALVAAGAISVATEVTQITAAGAIAMTLADGLFLGQRKTVTSGAGTGAPNATITPTTRGGGYATVSALGALGDTVEFIWANPTSPAWYIADSQGVTIA